MAAAALAATLPSIGCGSVRMRFDPTPAACRQPATPDGRTVRWLTPDDAGDAARQRSWCEAVGPVAAFVPENPGSPDAPAGRPLVVVSWNMAVGKGDLPGLLRDIRDAHAHADVILLLQEAYRAHAAPGECPAGSRRARAIGRPRSPGSDDILDVARRLGLHAVYAPSMRNGVNCAAEPREDRGNAILSTLPLSDVVAIELPFVRQRRVAVAARAARGAGTIHVLSTHFDTLRGHGAMARAIVQTTRLLAWTGPVVVGGDFNSALFRDRGIREMRRHFVELACGRGPTHHSGARLDHLFIGAGDPPLACRTGRRRHGSDHLPLIAVLPPP